MHSDLFETNNVTVLDVDTEIYEDFGSVVHYGYWLECHPHWTYQITPFGSEDSRQQFECEVTNIMGTCESTHEQMRRAAACLAVLHCGQTTPVGAVIFALTHLHNLHVAPRNIPAILRSLFPSNFAEMYSGKEVAAGTE